MKNGVLIIFYFVTIVFAFISGAVLSRVIVQDRELNIVYEKIDFVCGTYKTLLGSLEERVEAEKLKLIKYKNRKRKTK